MPKHVIDVLNEWLEAHLNNPYPTSLEKKELIAKTSLSNVQLSNWFINVRRRKLYSQYYDLKDKTDSSSIIKKKKINSINDSGVSRKRQSSVISIGNQNDNSNTNNININKNTDNGKTDLKEKEEENDDDKTSKVERKNSNIKLSTNINSNNESDYLFTKRRMSLQHILNDFPSETLPKPQQIQNKQSYIEKNRERKENNNNNNNNENNNSDEPPTPRIITEADEMKLEAKFKFQPFIRRKKLMDRLYDLKKIYYVADNEAGPEPLPETDSDE